MLKLIQVVGKRFRIHDAEDAKINAGETGIVCIGLSVEVNDANVKRGIETFISHGIETTV